ncbi:MAG TPA: lipase maturation factor family protein [Candidatus Limnocylindrales bacterium]|nr:lipase maturation factor family protein [Candidatus Limnocylindrales bacterium]
MQPLKRKDNVTVSSLMHWYFGDLWLVRLLLQRAFAAIYLIAFIVVLRQFKPLLGKNGLLPVPAFLERATWRDAPSLFHWRYSDRLLTCVGWIGLVLSAAAVAGLTDVLPYWAGLIVWLALWFLYLSIVNVGQKFYGFGWESMLLEAGFFIAFLGPARMQAPAIPMLILRWMLFRTELGAGLIKLRHDPCWRELTCLYYHYETQPIPNPLSWLFHRQPKVMHRFGVIFSHFVQVIVPFGLLAPQPIASIAGGFTMFHQFLLIVSGNYSWLNWLTFALGFSALNDSVFRWVLPVFTPALLAPPLYVDIILYALAAGTVWLSIKPTANLFSRNQMMNYSYNRYHLVNTYGAFGSVTRERYEVVIESTDAPFITEQTQWREYEFKAKPGDLRRMPAQYAPYHLRLDWMMWFLPFSVTVYTGGLYVPGFELWFLNFIRKLLEDDPATLRLLSKTPFSGKQPTFIRALFYHYRYTDPRQLRETGAWWTRELVGTYLPPISIGDFQRQWRRPSS